MQYGKLLHYITRPNKHSDNAAVAAIDIGTNTLRLLIGKFSEGRLERLASFREVTRLGKDLLSKGILNRDSIDISIRTLIEFKAICEKNNVSNILAFGTCALREAADADAFLKLAKETAGIDIRVISGEHEADLTIKGIRLGLHDSRAMQGCTLVIDIGGGSTEIILSNESDKMFSLPLGAVKLFESFIKHDPPSDCELSLLSEHIRAELEQPIEIIKKKIGCRHCNLIATGGTPTTLAAVNSGMSQYDGNKVHGMRLPYSSLKTLFEGMISMPLEDRRKIVGLESSRADIIIPGTIILTTMMDLLGTPEITVSDYGLMEGMFNEGLCSS